MRRSHEALFVDIMLDKRVKCGHAYVAIFCIYRYHRGDITRFIFRKYICNIYRRNCFSRDVIVRCRAISIAHLAAKSPRDTRVFRLTITHV